MLRLPLLPALLTLCAAIAATAGLHWPTPEVTSELTNVHGQTVTLFGQGLYATESAFMAPIQKGSDAVILCLVLPLFVWASIGTARGSRRAALLQTGLLAMLTYHAASLAFGTSYNQLFPVYILLFSVSFFTFTLSLVEQSRWRPTPATLAAMPRRGLVFFLCLSGLSVLVWLTEILTAAFTESVPSTLGMSTTSITFVLDIGLIAPACFLAAWMVWQGRTFGFVLALMMLTAYALMGIMVISQTLFQRAYGVIISQAELAIFVGSFVAVCLLAMVLLWRSLRAIQP